MCVDHIVARYIYTYLHVSHKLNEPAYIKNTSLKQRTNSIITTDNYNYDLTFNIIIINYVHVIVLTCESLPQSVVWWLQSVHGPCGLYQHVPSDLQQLYNTHRVSFNTANYIVYV